MRKTVLAVVVVVIVLAGGGRSLQAQEEQPPPEPAWSGSLGLAYLATSGNSDTSTFGLDFELKRDADPWGMELVAQLNQASDSGVKTAERYYADGRATYAASERWQYYAGLSGERNTFAGYDMRTVVQAGAQYILLPGPTQNLKVNAGLTYTDENAVGDEPSTDYVGGVAGLTYQWKINDQASLSEKLTYFADFDATANWRLWSTTALTSSVTNRLAIKLSYEVRYSNTPLPGFQSTDTTTSASVVWKI